MIENILRKQGKRGQKERIFGNEDQKQSDSTSEFLEQQCQK